MDNYLIGILGESEVSRGYSALTRRSIARNFCSRTAGNISIARESTVSGLYRRVNQVQPPPFVKGALTACALRRWLKLSFPVVSRTRSIKEFCKSNYNLILNSGAHKSSVEFALHVLQSK